MSRAAWCWTAAGAVGLLTAAAVLLLLCALGVPIEPAGVDDDDETVGAS